MTASYHTTDLSAQILDAAAAAIVTIDKEGNIVRCNRAATRLTGISQVHHTLPQFETSVIFPADIDRWRFEIERALAGLFSRWSEIRWNCSAGSVRTLACSFAPIRDTEGEVECVACTAIPCHSAELLSDRAIELREIERFLHDTVAQDLAALACTLAPIEARSRGLEVHGDAAAALDMADRCCRDVRIMSSMLTAPLTPGRAVERAMEQIARHLRDDAGLEVVLDIDPVSDALPDGARTLLLTVFQQWCARGARHTPRPRLKARLRERPRGVVLELEALEVKANAALRTGWSVVRERTRALGGEFDITRDCVRLVLPTSALPISGGP